MLFVDLSSNNPGPRDWNRVRAAGIGGALFKATQGGDYISPTFGSDYTAAAAAGLVVGAYHFWDPRHPLMDQLAWFRAHYGPRPGHDFPAVVDAEWNPTNRSWADLAAELAAGLDWLAGQYADAWVYLNRSWAGALNVQHHGVWLAQGTVGPCAGAEAMQFAPATVPGLTGPIDWSYTDWRPHTP